jgi:ribosomal protein S3
MGQKANPISLRLNINRNFESSWYQDLNYSNILKHELSIRNYIRSLFSFMSVYQGRILFQFFPKKLTIHSFITNKNLISKVLIKKEFKSGQNTKKPLIRVSSIPTINRNTKQQAILLFMSYVLGTKDSKHSRTERSSFSSLGGTPSYPLFLYLISNSKKLYSKKVNLTPSLNTNLSQYNYSSSSFFQNVLPPLETGTKMNIDLFTLKLKSKYQSASFLAQYIAECFEKNVSFRQVYKQIQKEILQDKTILGLKIQCAGRINGAEIAKVESKKMGQTSLHTFSAQVDFSKAEAYTVYGIIGIKVWISCIPQSTTLLNSSSRIGFEHSETP